MIALNSNCYIFMFMYLKTPWYNVYTSHVTNELYDWVLELCWQCDTFVLSFHSIKILLQLLKIIHNIEKSNVLVQFACILSNKRTLRLSDWFSELFWQCGTFVFGTLLTVRYFCFAFHFIKVVLHVQLLVSHTQLSRT